MNEEERLSRLDTLWSVVHRAHGDVSIDARAARQELMARYGGAARRYLLGALRNENDADEVFQEFSLRMVRGDFHRADPQRGKFRMFVKTALFRMIVDFQRARSKADKQLDLDNDRIPETGRVDGDELFAQKWRSELIEKTLDELRLADRRSGSHLYEILQLRISYPKLRSPELAAKASIAVSKNISAVNFRAILSRARLQFAILLLDAVRQSLSDPTREDLETELGELLLLEYCRPALELKPD